MGRIVTMTLEEILARKPDFDRAKFASFSEEEIRQQVIEDGYDPDYEPVEWVRVVPAQSVRQQLGMTQDAFAAALGIPVATLRNWEQGRTKPDPAAQSLLRAVSRNPGAVLAAIAG